MKKYFAIALLVLLPHLSFATSLSAQRQTPEDVLKNYENGNLRVLIVPGHSNTEWGTDFRGVREADLNVSLAWELEHFLSTDRNLSVLVTRDENGEYSPWLKNYMEEGRTGIEAFRDASRRIFSDALSTGAIGSSENVYHNDASRNTGFELYAINKFANDNRVDIVLHIHFNDYSRRSKTSVGTYGGFSIYIPERQLPNFQASQALADAIKLRLERIIPPSDLPAESDIVIEDQSLIAIGSNASRNGASILIEYSYIYEPMLRSVDVRDAFLKESAFQTYLGLNAYFNRAVVDPKLFASDHQSTLLPYTWDTVLRFGTKESRDVLALQHALIREGMYPPRGETLTNCPANSNFGNCTKRAVVLFQEKYAATILVSAQLVRGSGYVGPATLRKLNELYGVE